MARAAAPLPPKPPKPNPRRKAQRNWQRRYTIPNLQLIIRKHALLTVCRRQLRRNATPQPRLFKAHADANSGASGELANLPTSSSLDLSRSQITSHQLPCQLQSPPSSSPSHIIHALPFRTSRKNCFRRPRRRALTRTTAAIYCNHVAQRTSSLLK